MGEETERRKRKSRFDVMPEDMKEEPPKNYFKDDSTTADFTSKFLSSILPTINSLTTTNNNNSSSIDSNPSIPFSSLSPSSSTTPLINPITASTEFHQQQLFKMKIQKALNKNLEYIRKKDALLALPLNQQFQNIIAPPKKVPIDIRNPVRAPRTTGIGAAATQPIKRQEPNTSIYVTGFPSDITEEEVGILFSVLGKIKRTKLYTHSNGVKKGDALITFNKPEVVPVACSHYNGRDIGGGCVLSVTKATFNDDNDKKNDNSSNKNRSNRNNENNITSMKFTDEELRAQLPFNCLSDSHSMTVLWNVYESNSVSLHSTDFFTDLEMDLKEELNQYGPIKSLQIPFHCSLNGTVIVVFESEDSSRRCLEGLKERNFDGRQILSQILQPIKREEVGEVGEAKRPERTERTETVEEEILDPNVIEAVQDVEDFLNSLL